jgi:hypothetical protein
MEGVVLARGVEAGRKERKTKGEADNDMLHYFTG